MVEAEKPNLSLHSVRVRPGLMRGAILPLLAGIYVLAAKSGLALAVVHPSATAVWAPTGIAIAANLVLGYWVWPAFAVGAFLVNVTTAGSVATSLAIAAGNALEGFAGAWLVNRLAGGRTALTRPLGVFEFAFLAAGLAPMVSATVGVTALSVGGYADWSGYGAVWTTWWLGDAAGALIVAPLVILWSSWSPAAWSRGQKMEGLALLLTLVALCQVLFDTTQHAAESHYPLGYVVLPVLVWAAFRLGSPATAMATFLLSILAVIGTLRGLGPFAVTDRNASLLLLQAFVGVLSMTFLALAAAVQERNRLFIGEREARSQAEEALAARDEFLSVASHELKTPVAALKGSAQLVRRRLETGDQHAGRFEGPVKVIEETADRLAHLVEDLLDVSRLRTGHLPVLAAPLDLAALVRHCVERAEVLASPAHRFSLAVDAPKCLVAGDPERLDQVLTNLLDNAIKYSPRGGEIAVSLAEVAEDDGLLVKVQDSGMGLPAGSEQLIFEPFGRAANALADQLPGMGLGLYICRSIVERHGGRIWAESAGPERGTAISFWLPRSLVDDRIAANV